MPLGNDYKCVFNFFSSGKKGGTWSETWYRNAASMVAATTFPPALLLARMLLASPQTQLTKIRVSQVGNPRVTAIVQQNLQGVYFPATTPAPIDSAIVCNVSSSIVPATRRWWLRGWDAAMANRSQATGNDVFSSGTGILLGAWFGQLASNAFEILPIQRNVVGGSLALPVSQIDGTPGNGQSVATITGPGFPQSNSIYGFYRFSKKDLPGLSGRFTSLTANGQLLTIPYLVPGNLKVATPGAYIRLIVPVSGCTIDPTISGPSFIGGRQTRSPFTGSRGAKHATRGLRLSP